MSICFLWRITVFVVYETAFVFTDYNVFTLLVYETVFVFTDYNVFTLFFK